MSQRIGVLAFALSVGAFVKGSCPQKLTIFIFPLEGAQKAVNINFKQAEIPISCGMTD